MGSLTKAKAAFLLASMAGWLLLGGILIYLCPSIYDLLAHSEQSSLWLQNLAQSGYRPGLGLAVGIVILALEGVANWVWYGQFNGKI